MRILVTGSNGFVGKNLVSNLNNIKDNKDKTHPRLLIEDVYEYDINSSFEELDYYCKNCDFVFNIAGVNRPIDKNDFYKGNSDFIDILLDNLKKYNNNCPIMLSSSIQASLVGRYANSDYGKSKLLGEKKFFEYGKNTNTNIYVYRFPNIFGKWCKPNYNSVIATFCNNIANDLPIRIDDRNVELELLYIDDLVGEMISLLEGNYHKCNYDGISVVDSNDGMYCYVPNTYTVSLGSIVDLLYSFKNQRDTLIIPDVKKGTFSKKLYSTYLSYLPKEKISIPLKTNVDYRGSFTELIKLASGGQVSINISKPGMKKGMHWHNTKWEFFIVVSGHALIKERNLYSNEVIEFDVSGEKMQAIHMLPGYVHLIENISKTEDLITVMWANEFFDINRPDTFFEEVDKDVSK